MRRFVLPLTLLSLVVSLGSHAAAEEVDDKLGQLQRDQARKFVTLAQRFNTFTAENLALEEAIYARMLEDARTAEVLPIRIVGQRARALADDIVRRLKIARALPETDREGRRREAVAMIEDLTKVFTLIGANSGSRFGALDQGFGRAAATVVATFGGGIFLDLHPTLFVGADNVGFGLTALAVPLFGMLLANEYIPPARRFLTWFGGTERTDDQLAVTAFDRFWTYLEGKIIPDPEFADFTAFEGQLYFAPKLMSAIFDIGGDAHATCDAWLTAPAVTASESSPGVSP
jgi:hypothetical protein